MFDEEELHCRLVADLKQLRLPVDEVSIRIRPYSKTLYGRYYPVEPSTGNPAVFIYPYRTESMDVMFPYSTVLYHTIHEMVHHLQHSNPSFVRRKGIMHDTEFKKLMNRYVKLAESKHLLRKERVEL